MGGAADREEAGAWAQYGHATCAGVPPACCVHHAAPAMSVAQRQPQQQPLTHASECLMPWPPCRPKANRPSRRLRRAACRHSLLLLSIPLAAALPPAFPEATGPPPPPLTTWAVSSRPAGSAGSWCRKRTGCRWAAPSRGCRTCRRCRRGGGGWAYTSGPGGAHGSQGAGRWALCPMRSGAPRACSEPQEAG